MKKQITNKKYKQPKERKKRDAGWCRQTYRPERPKGAKDEVKRPKGPPTRSRGPEGPQTSSILIKFKCFPRWCYTDEASTEWEYCSPPGEVFQYFPLIKVRSLNVDISTGAGHCLYSEWPRLYRRVCHSG